jgi:DNA-directed RNA polymerase subunit RPC12/RpoP
MARIIKDVGKSIQCSTCQRTVGYDSSDVFTDYQRQYDETMRSIQSIYCPSCGKKIAVCY